GLAVRRDAQRLEIGADLPADEGRRLLQPGVVPPPQRGGLDGRVAARHFPHGAAALFGGDGHPRDEPDGRFLRVHRDAGNLRRALVPDDDFPRLQGQVRPGPVLLHPLVVKGRLCHGPTPRHGILPPRELTYTLPADVVVIYLRLLETGGRSARCPILDPPRSGCASPPGARCGTGW